MTNKHEFTAIAFRGIAVDEKTERCLLRFYLQDHDELDVELPLRQLVAAAPGLQNLIDKFTSRFGVTRVEGDPPRDH